MKLIKQKNSRHFYHGFTLIELMVAISIVAILATVGFSTYSQSQLRARDAKRKLDLRSVATALELHYQRLGRFPCSGTTWQASNAATWLTDSTSCTGGTNTTLAPNYIDRMPKDPTSDNGVPTAATGFGYAYFSINAVNGSCAIGQYYVLIAKLENPNDADRLGTTSISHCGANITTATGYQPSQFIIVGQ